MYVRVVVPVSITLSLSHTLFPAAIKDADVNSEAINLSTYRRPARR